MQTNINGTASPLPPNGSSKSSADMTMNGNKPPSQGGVQSSTNSTSSNNVARSNLLAAPTVKQRHQQTKGGSNVVNTDDSNFHSVSLSGGSPTDNDSAYCTEIARRSVARAALHLGMEGMEGSAMDALGSVLIGYMDQVGTTISANVETSGRSSAHANAYDALNAVEICTAPAAAQVASSSQLSASASESATPQLSQPADRLKDPQQDQRGRGWEGLASFLFGNDWFSIPLEGEKEEKERARKEAEAAAATSLSGKKDGTSILLQSNGKTNVSATAKKPGGKTMLPSRPPGSTSPPKSGMGKQFANLKAADKTVQFSLERKDSKGVPDGGPGPAVTGDINGSSDINVGATGRWHAPYPNTIQAFPVVKNATSIANPHRFTEGSNISLSLHDLATEMEACRDTPPAAKKARRGSASAKDSSSTVPAKTARLRDEVADKAMRKALRIPDDVYTTRGTIWGMIQDKNDGSAINRKKEAVADGEKKPAMKKSAKDGKDGKTTAASKVKFDLNASKKNQEEPFPNPGISGRIAQEMPSYVPNFLPPFPTDEYSDMTSNRLSASMSASAVMGDVLTRMHHREKRKTPPSAAGEGGDGKISERDAVRRSLIGLGKPAGSSYWGSSWLENDTDGTSKSNNSKTEQFLSEITVAEGEGTAAAAKKPESNAPQVAPLGRASGSRLSKILEGSMNVS